MSDAPLSPETIVRRAALVIVPLLVLVGYLLRSKAPDAPSPAAASGSITNSSGSGEVASGSSAAPASGSLAVEGQAPRRLPAPTPSPSAQALLGEQASKLPVAPLPPPPALQGTPAVDLPHAEEPRAQRSPSAAVAPCGGLVARLITHSEDKDFAFASLARGFTEPAQVLRIGESIGSFRVTAIEWDRVWVQSSNERCAVGMHFGARDAQEQTDKQLSAEEYARLPWVLPQAIASGLDKRAEMEFELSEAAIAALYARGADVFAGLRIKIVKSEGPEARALQLFDVRLDSFLERLGIESGDILVSIDDKPVGSTEAVEQALDEARDAEALVAHFLRDGEPFRLSLRARAQPELP